MKEIKQRIYKKLTAQLAAKIKKIQENLASIAESRDKETKSSAGDKYETGRAMMQLEYEKQEMQLFKTLELKKKLHSINIDKQKETINLGSLVMTNQGRFFISIGLGKVIIDSDTYYAISVQSPIGQLLLNKKVGDSIIFNQKEIEITDLY